MPCIKALFHIYLVIVYNYVPELNSKEDFLINSILNPIPKISIDATFKIIGVIIAIFFTRLVFQGKSYPKSA